MYSKEDEKDSDDDDDVRISFDKVVSTNTPTASCFSYISLQICNKWYRPYARAS